MLTQWILKHLWKLDIKAAVWYSLIMLSFKNSTSSTRP